MQGIKRVGVIGLVVFIAVGAYLVNRTPSGPPIDPNLLADTHWDIRTINDDPSSGSIRFDGEWVAFTSGLNDINFRYEIDGDRLLVKDGQIFSTIVGSLDPVVQVKENRLTRALTGGHMRLDGNRLTVSSGGATVTAELRGRESEQSQPQPVTRTTHHW